MCDFAVAPMALKWRLSYEPRQNIRYNSWALLGANDPERHFLTPNRIVCAINQENRSSSLGWGRLEEKMDTYIHKNAHLAYISPRCGGAWVN